ncbi:MAG: dienelactone hydrolase family protein [Planctomycetes bacterium]|nr:dienelactone hydrolase family protein [Planctomycetota bacterium]
MPVPRIILGSWIALWLLLPVPYRAAAEDSRRTLKSDAGQEYYLYEPATFDPKKRYWLFVAVHGLGSDGQNALGFASFADEGQCIVVGPTFGEGFQFPSQGAGKKLLAILAELNKEYRVHPTVFLAGMSAGAQFAHRFALEHPKSVLACAAHSAGSWDAPNDAARGIPFLVTCGEADTEFDRIGKAKAFSEQLKRKGYKVVTAWFPGVGHSLSPEACQLSKDFYWTATTGLTRDQRDRVEAELAKAEERAKAEGYEEALKLLAKVADLKRDSVYTQRAADLAQQIQKTASERFSEIQKQASTDLSGAITELGQFLEKFKGTKAARSAQQTLAAWKSKNASIAEGEASGGTKKVEAEPKSRENRTGAEEAAKPATRSQGPPKSGRPWLVMAKNFLANRQPEKAREYLEKILKTFPDAEEAVEARKLLDDL